MREERPLLSPLTSQLSRMSKLSEHFPEDEKLFVKIGMEFSMQLVLKLYITSKNLDTAFSLI